MSMLRLENRLRARRITRPIARTIFSEMDKPQSEEFCKAVDRLRGKLSIDFLIGKIPESFIPAPVDPDAMALHLDLKGTERGKWSWEARKVIENYRSFIWGVAEQHPQPFRVSKAVRMGFDLVLVGSMMKLDGYDAVPLYVKKPGQRTRLVFAYKSKSHECWRRFAGYTGIFHKGRDQFLQTFDWRIQRALDEVVREVPRTRVMGPKGLMRLEDFCPIACQPDERLRDAARAHILATESYLQKDAQAYDMGREVEPVRLLDYWADGDIDGPYGRYLNLVVASADYTYCIALTTDGLFPKFAQYHTLRPDVNMAGAPAEGVSVPDEVEWVFTPLVEYNGSGPRKLRHLSGVEIHATSVQNWKRVRIKGIHEKPRSPLFRLSNGLNELCMLLRTDCFDLAESKVRRMLENGGSLPLSDEAPRPYIPADDSEEVLARHDALMKAFEAYREGRLVKHTVQGRELMLECHITPREMALFKRYSKYLDDVSGQEGVPDFAMHVVNNRMLRVAVQFVEDMHAPTSTGSYEPVPEDPPHERMLREIRLLTPGRDSMPFMESASIRIDGFTKDILGQMGLVDAWSYSRGEVAVASTLSVLPLAMAESDRFGKDMPSSESRRAIEIHGAHYSIWKGQSRDALVLRWENDELRKVRDYPDHIREIARQLFPELSEGPILPRRRDAHERRTV